MDKSARVKGPGELSIRVSDLEAMLKFYEEVVGLEVPRRDNFSLSRWERGRRTRRSTIAIGRRTDDHRECRSGEVPYDASVE
jgi:catechol-2,3-dioxygenase